MPISISENINSNSDTPGGNPVSQEELPNHLKNCSLYSRLSPVDCALQNKYFVFILSLRFLLELKHVAIFCLETKETFSATLMKQSKRLLCLWSCHSVPLVNSRQTFGKPQDKDKRVLSLAFQP